MSASRALRGVGNEAKLTSDRLTSLTGTSAKLVTGLSAVSLAAVGAGTAVGVGLGVAAAGGAVLAAAQADKVKQAFSSLADHVKEQMVALSGPVQNTLVDLSTSFRHTFDSLRPVIGNLFTQIAPIVKTLGESFAGAAAQATRLFGPLLQQVRPIIDAFADELTPTITSLFSALSSITAPVAANTQAIHGLFAVVQTILPFVGQLLGMFAQLGAQIMPTLVPAISQLAASFTGALKPVLPVIGDAINRMVPALANLASEFLQLAGPVLGALTPALADVVTTFVGELAPVLPDLARALTELIPPLAALTVSFVKLGGPVIATLASALAGVASALATVARFMNDHIHAVEAIVISYVALRVATAAMNVQWTVLAARLATVGRSAIGAAGSLATVSGAMKAGAFAAGAIGLTLLLDRTAKSEQKVAEEASKLQQQFSKPFANIQIGDTAQWRDATSQLTSMRNAALLNFKSFSELEAIGTAYNNTLGDMPAKERAAETNVTSLTGKFHLSRDAVLALAKANDIDLSDSYTKVSGALDKAISTTVRGLPTTLNFSTAVTKVGTAANDADTQVTQFNSALQTLFGNNLSAAQAADTFQQKINDLSKSLATGSRTLQGNSNAAIQNRGAIFELVQGALTHVEALKKQGKSTNEVTQALQGDITQIYAAAKATGLNKGQVDQLLKSLGILPPQKGTKINADTSQASTAVGGLLGQISRLPSRKDIQVVVSTAGSIGALGALARRAKGGPVVPGGMYLVGERGPELLAMGARGGMVTPLSQAGERVPLSGSPGRAGGGTTNVTNVYMTVQGSVKTERELVRVIRDGIVRDGKSNGGRNGL